MKIRRTSAGFTLSELLVSMAASVLILGALVMSSLGLQRSLHGSEVYASAYSDQRRLIDYVARDLRRALSVAATDDTGAAVPIAAGAVEVSDRATLVLTLPAYYGSDAPGDAAFDQPLPVVAAGGRLDYGTDPAGAPPPVPVSFRKIFVGEEACVCFVREEAGAREIIVRGAEELFLRVAISPDGRSGLMRAWFRSAYSRDGTLIFTYDEVMLRNRRDAP